MVMRRRTARKKRSTRPLRNFGGSPARRTGGWVVLVLAALVVVNLYVFVWDKQTSVGAIKREADRATPAAALPARPLERRSRENQDDRREREALERRSRENQDDRREREALERRSRENQDDRREREALERRSRENQD